MTATALKKAQLEIEDDEAPIDCWFNPNAYTISKTNDWHIKPVVGAALPHAQFGGGRARELTLALLFDASDAPNHDVSDVTDRLFKVMEVNPALASSRKNKGRPPMLTFSWGKTVGFKAVATSLSIQFTLFDQDGAPIRAEATLSLQQAETADSRSSRGPARGQNPTTRAQAGARSHVIRDGDSLQSIAHVHYGDPTAWRTIAEANDIDDPMRLRRGSEIDIPLLEQ
ncbi:MAG: CIS tube protein [Solirubrobacterales bacterium]